MRTLFSALVVLTGILLCASLPANAQERVTSYSFAPSRHVAIEQKTTSLGKIVDSVGGALDPLKGERGTTLLLGCTGLTLLGFITGLPILAVIAGACSVLLVLLNNPALLVLFIVPLFMFRHEIMAMFASTQDERDSDRRATRTDQPLAASLVTDKAGDQAKEKKNKDGKKSKDAIPPPVQKADSSSTPKLARPL